MTTSKTVTVELASALDAFNRRSAWLRDAQWYGTQAEYSEAKRAFDESLAAVRQLQGATCAEAR